MNRKRRRTLQSLANARMQAKRPITIPGLRINVVPNQFQYGPYKVESLIVKRQRKGEVVEISKKALIDGNGRPVTFGSNKWLAKQLKKYEFGYAKWLMTRGTEAEGL